MKITALEEYGLRCMILLARSGESTLSLSDFSQHEGLSIPYAGKLLMILKKANLVRAARGRNGGYALARNADRVFLKDILNALGEPVFSPTHCQKFTGEENVCVHTGDCSVRDIWKGFGGIISDMLGKITLADIASRDTSVMENLRTIYSKEVANRET
jgi:Rrf2 family protein